MSHSATLADYRAVLTTPGAGVPVLTAILARLPIAMVGLSLLLYVQRTTGSFAIAGLVSAGVLIGVAIGSVLQGRIIDRTGPSVPLLITTAAFAVTVTGAILAVEARLATPLLVIIGCGVGLSQPQVGSTSRALWTRLLPSGPARDAAYAYEAISLEVFFILGPALAGLLVVVPWAGTGVLAGAVCMVIGAAGFALSSTVRAVRPQWTSAASRGGRMLGALVSPGMRTVALAALGFGLTVGFVEVAVPAAATKAGHAPIGGLLLAIWSASSVIFGVAYSMRPWPRRMHLRLPVLLAGFALMIAPLAVPSTLLGLSMMMVLAGTLITPQSTAHSIAIEQVALPHTVTEAFGWVITAVTLGLAIGQSISGYLVEHVSIGASFLASTGAGLLIALGVWMRRGTVLAGVPDQHAEPAELASAR